MASLPLVAASAGVAAYLNARYHITKDVHTIWHAVRGEMSVTKAEKADKVSPWYYFEEQVERMPKDDECLWSRTGCYNWQETRDQAVRYAQFMLSLGADKGQLVGLYMSNSPEFFFAHMGTWVIGSAPACVNYNLAGEALVHCVKLSGTKILLADWDSDCIARIDEVRPQLEQLGVKVVVLTEETRREITSAPVVLPDERYRKGLSPRSPMALFYTSGSTGLPKAVSFPISRLLPLRHQQPGIVGIKPGPNGDRFYVCMPLYHGTGGALSLSCLISGTPVCIGRKFNGKHFWNEIRDSRSSAFVYVGEALRYLLSQPPSPLDKEHNVRIIVGNGLRPDVWSKFQNRFGIETVAEFFSSSEGVFGTLAIGRGPFMQKSVGHEGGLMRLLQYGKHATAKIDHETGDIYRDPKTGFGIRTPLSEGGEVLVRVKSEEEFPGYWKNKAATDKKFAKNLFKDGDLWFRSGDALRRDNDGLWYFLDRLGDTYRWKSENVATMEVAEAIGHFPGIAEAAVYGVLVPGHDGRAGCAAIHLADNKSPDEHFWPKLLKYSSAKLPRYAVPVFIRHQQQVTPMHNQKQNKTPLKKDGLNMDLIYGSGKDFYEAQKEGKDVLFWNPAALGMSPPAASKSGGGEAGYVPLTRADWAAIESRAGQGQEKQEQSRM